MKKFLAIVLALALVCVFCACGPVEEKAKIGGCYASLGFDFQLQMSNGIKRAAEEKGYEYVSYDYNFDSEAMISGIETLVNSNVKAYYGLFVSAASDALKNNPEVGVLTQGEVIPGAVAGTINDYKTLANQFVDSLDNYIKANNITKGNFAGLWLESCENKDSDYYTAMTDMKEIITTYLNSKGFGYSADYFPQDDESAANITAQLMNSDPDLRFVFAFNNGFAISCANEISSAVADAKEYFVFSSEGDPESFRLIASGTSPYRGCAYMNIENSGYAVGLQLINWIENGKMENVIVVKDLVDIRNVADFMD